MLSLALLAAMHDTQDTKLPEVKMGRAQMVYLVSPKTQPEISESDSAAKQKAHLEFLEGLWTSRKALVVGPLVEAGDIRGLVLLDVESADKAREVMAEDPWVKAGALEVKTHTWFFAKNYVQKAPKFMELGKYWYGVLERPAGLEPLDKQKGEEMQRGHMDNIRKMAEDGYLLLAGPMAEDTPFRGIFVFRDMPKEKIDEIVAPDPLVKHGRLKLTVYQWYTAKGSFVAEK